MPYTKAISPVSNSYLTKGKEYEIVQVVSECLGMCGFCFIIIGDNGNRIAESQHNSPKLNGLSWQLK